MSYLERRWYNMLSGKQKRHLRSLANNLNSTVQVGKEGISANLVDSADKSLEAHELIKVNVLKNCEDPFKEIAFDLAGTTNSEIVQTVGRTIVLYRKSKKRLIEL